MADGDAELQDLYRDVLIDYFRDGTHKGELPDADIRAHGANPTCGDEIKITIVRRGDVIEGIRFAGHGCVISQASSAMMCEAVEGRTTAEARGFVAAFRAMMVENLPADRLPEALGELEALEGVRKFPIRVKCALLSWITLLQGLDDAIAGKAQSEYTETA
ncbi:MAG: Fe-S cluster assembly sulfur transfer protein SufU [Elusimicrobiota bacterium]